MNIKKTAIRVWKFLCRKSLQLQQWLIKTGPDKRTQKGAIIAILIGLIAYFGYDAAITLRTGKGLLFDTTLGVIIGLLCFFLISFGIRLALRILSKIPRVYGSFFIGALITFLLFFDFSFNDALPFVGWIYLTFALFGGSITAFFFGDFRKSGVLNKIFVALSFMLSVAGAVLFIIFLGRTGTEEGLVKVAKYEQTIAKTLNAPNPSLNGSYAIKTLSYGSGKDRRDIFGKDAQIITQSVNGKAFVPKLSGRFNELRKKFWGFNRTKFPINGRVWYPDGEGIFPLVLIVHGNHSMREYSDPGYAYLGEFLASKGYIVVSVDENFLNGDWTQNYRTENDARGWMLLEHLSTWKKWNADPENPFFHKVDMNKISLIGHSRGGEAVAIAASFNNLPFYPDDAKVKFDYHFNIKSVIAIAPVDGQYMPSNQSTPLKNINYLLFQGSHDSDVSSFSGDKQFKRIKFDDGEYKFKSSIYIYRANHGQFNTVWGNHDRGMPGALLLNTKALLKGEEQRQIAKVYIGAFLETTLKGNQSYLPIFKDYRYAEEWLPKTLYINRFEDSETKILCDYDEDIDVTTTTVQDGKLLGENLRIWKEEDLGYRRGSGLRQNKAVYLGWENAQEKKDSTMVSSEKEINNDTPDVNSDEPTTGAITLPTYTITLPESQYLSNGQDSITSLVFSVAQLDEKVPKPDSLDTSEEKENWSFNQENNNQEDNNNQDKEKPKEEGKKNTKKDDKKKKGSDDKDEAKIPVDFTIELIDANGQTSSLCVSEIISIMPPFEAKFMRYDKLNKGYGKSSEPVLQTVAVPLELFHAKNPEILTSNIKQIKYIFNKTAKGVIVLDEIGFREAL